MDKTDIDKLFELLKLLYPNARQVQAGNGVLKKTWRLVLEPYDYEAVKAATIDYARGNKFFPDPADLTMRCPVEAPKRETLRVVHREEDVDKLYAMAEEIEAKYSAVGIPGPSEALEMGWSFERWSLACSEAGI